MSTFVDNIFLNQQCSFRKGYSTQHCLLVILETWERSLDKGKVFGALLADLLTVFDRLDHELVTAALNGCGFSFPALQLINNYLSNRKQRTKIENTYSTWLDIIFGVPQGSILGPLHLMFLKIWYCFSLEQVMKIIQGGDYAISTAWQWQRPLPLH